MTQSFVSVSPNERRSVRSKEFVLIGNGERLIITVLDSAMSVTLHVCLCVQGPAGPLHSRSFPSCCGAGRDRPSPLIVGQVG